MEIKYKMIYTIGHKESYIIAYKKTNGDLKKMGKKEGLECEKCGIKPYEGGWVWKNIRDAKKFLIKDYALFGVKAIWNKDTEPNIHFPWHNLLVDSQIVLLEES